MLMILCSILSVVIYQVASIEIHNSLDKLETSLQLSQKKYSSKEPRHEAETQVARQNLTKQLLSMNIFVLFIGGFVSYYLARRSLIPIRKAHEAQSRFTSDASHELRTPLAVMKTELEVAISDEKATVKELKDVLRSNLEEVDKLSKLSEMLLSISRIDDSGLKFGAVNINKVTKEVIKDFGKPAERITLNSKKQQIVFGNDVAIADIIKILIDNALLYSPIDSKIDITIFSKEEYAIFEISNSGAGISADKLPLVFNRFYRADSSRTNGQHKGYGLGLALAKNLTELHNGTLSASSIPNKVTKFTLKLPLKSSVQ